jgi:PIN domain nuclease of toxin-antitoxin system
MEKMQASLAALSADLLIASQHLPVAPPSDPADRIVIATARHFSLTIVTRDETILRYGRAGHAHVMEC